MPAGTSCSTGRSPTPSSVLAWRERSAPCSTTPTLARYLIGGIVKADLVPLTVPSLTWRTWHIDDFVPPPLPNTLFQRDSAAWIGNGVTVNPMAKAVRRRESINTRAVLHHHPRFSSSSFCIYYGDEDADYAAATLEGGDSHVLGPGIVAIGLG